MKRFALAAAFLAFGVARADAAAILVTFTADTAGNKPNGYSSPESAFITFTDTIGTNLTVLNATPQTIGQGLAVAGDDASRLQMNFGGLVDSFALDFGNDDPGFTVAGDRAWLRLFNGAVQVGEVSVVMNRNDIMDQTIAFSGLLFDNALFWYGNAAATPIGLIEVVDNVRVNTAVPEPATLLTLGLGLTALARRRRRS